MELLEMTEVPGWEARQKAGMHAGFPVVGPELPSPADRCIIGLFRETENVAVTATATADKTGAVTGSSWSGPAYNGQVLVPVTIVPLAITKRIFTSISMALWGIARASLTALSGEDAHEA